MHHSQISQCGVSNLEINYENGAYMATCNPTKYNKNCGLNQELYQDWAC
jgi:hypothetical protein